MSVFTADEAAEPVDDETGEVVLPRLVFPAPVLDPALCDDLTVHIRLEEAA